MKFSLIICTYMRPKPLLGLLQSVDRQTLYPDEILIIDGSTNNDTRTMLDNNIFDNLKYFMVSDVDRGLTRQRNFGIAKTSDDIDVVCFLDDDTLLETEYFEKLIATYSSHPAAVAVGGYITNEVSWAPAGERYSPSIDEFHYDGWKRKEGSRHILRKRLGLDSDCKPGFLPEFAHGRSVGFLPPSGKIYEVEQLMGGVSSYRKDIFSRFRFSEYFDGYGLYEDADFSLRLSKAGKLYINTAARLAHHHDQAGRPNKFKYGKMVVRNGWYVWRIKYPEPSLKARLKWHAITLLLTAIRFFNIFTTSRRKEAFTETLGRLYGWASLFLKSPRSV